MNESIQVEPFEGKFQDVIINFHSLALSFLTEVILEATPRITGYTGVFHKVQVHHYTDKGKECVGEIIIMFRNQGKDFSSCLQLKCTILAMSKSETSGRSLFCKIVQYLFEWADKYVEERSITDTMGEPFILPRFTFAKDQFTMIED